ncbi:MULTISPECIES: hypothetical protein [unclassified Coleofasciculus]|uniref:hypothetical protein n=1 Tax=Cyanophyceae TaxID=3028117 RepID=UPI001687E38F|nr:MULTISPECIES: hypothetical protein [unclassified Coleofasciculus]MBD1838145.1 hypothetical protein [Coleofasciculus sp. FACHB-501]MBD1889230.1 hypothetical protein [Coleofasciculus sp. FACHB-SPT9]
MNKKTKLVLGVLAGMGFASCLLPQLTLAQSTLSQPGAVSPADTFQEQNTDPFSRTNNGGASGVFDLMHRATLGNIRSMDEFNTDQKNNLNTAADQFRRQQLQLLGTPNQAAPVAPVTPANSVTPASSTP